MAPSKKYVCLSCRKNVNKNQYSIKCVGSCAGYFHEGCCGLSKKQFAGLLEKRDHGWKCKSCISRDREIEVSDQSVGSDSDLTSGDEEGIKKHVNNEVGRKSISNKPGTYRKSHMPESQEEDEDNLTSKSQKHNKQQKYKQSKSNEGNELLDLSEKINPSNSDIMKYLRCRFRDFEESLAYYGDSLDELKQSIRELSKENQQLKKDRDVMERRIQNLEKEVRKCSEVAAIGDREDRKRNIIIFGVPTTKEKCKGDVQKLFEALNVNIPPQEIKTTRLLQSKNNETPVLVSFESKDTRSSIMDARKRKGTITVRECNIQDSDRKIFINEDLPKDTRQLFDHARKLKSKGFKFVWCKNAKVYARRENDSEVIYIKDNSQIKVLEEDPKNLVR